MPSPNAIFEWTAIEWNSIPSWNSLFHPAVPPSFPNLLLSPEMEFLYHLGSAHKPHWMCIQSRFLSMTFLHISQILHFPYLMLP